MGSVALFSPRSPDGRAEWRIALDLFLKTPQGGVVTHEALGAALNRDPVDERHAIYAACAKAGRELRKSHSRSIAAVPGVGYRVLEASEHEQQAYGYHTQATRRMNTAVAVLRSTPLDDLTPEQRRRTLAATAVMSNMASVLTHVASEQRKQEAAIESLRSKVTNLEEQMGISTQSAEELTGEAAQKELEAPDEDATE